MTVREFYAVSDFDSSFALDFGNGEEVLISKEDKALMKALGDVLVDHAMVNTVNRLCIYACVDLRRAAV